MNENIYDVTFLVASYNPEWYALKRTLCSALNQKYIKFQIVIADDGSKETFRNEVIKLFEEYEYKDYKFIEAEINKGTCLNIYNGLLSSEGEYIKTIGPGDCLYNESTLSTWVDYAKNNSADICFGDSVFFAKDATDLEIVISKRRYPQNIDPYLKDNYCIKEGIYNYVLLGDVVWGSNLLTRRDVMITYMQRIIGKIKYAEDMIYRMMIADGKKMTYFPKNVIWYEYGSGISTSGDSKWREIISNERKISNKLIIEKNIYKGVGKLRFNFVMKCLSNKKSNWIKYLLYPNLIFYKIRKNMININTTTDVNIEFLYQICTIKKQEEIQKCK